MTIFSFKKDDEKDNKIKNCVKNYTVPLPSFLVGRERKYKSKFYLVPIKKSIAGKEKKKRNWKFIYIDLVLEKFEGKCKGKKISRKREKNIKNRFKVNKSFLYASLNPFYLFSFII